MTDFEYHAFLSYSSLDHEWAELFEAQLIKQNFSIFRDKTRLNAGNDWNKELQQAISNSRHLIVLWSENAEKSQWVTQEMTHFELDKKELPSRRHIHVDLKGQSQVYAHYHAIDDLKTAGVYDAGFQALQLNSEPWRNVWKKLGQALNEAEIPVYEVVLASTLGRLQNIDLQKNIAFMPTFGDTLESMGVKKDASDSWKDELAKYYGVDRSEWKPFGGANNIRTILDDLATKIHAIASAPRFRWEEIDTKFWTVNAAGKDDPKTLEIVNAELRKLIGDLVLIIIDPISLYDGVVFNRLSALRTTLQNSPTATSVLAPFPIPKPTYHLRKLIETGVADLYKQYYEPVFAEENRLAALEVCALEDQDLKRLLGATLRFRRKKLETPAMLQTRSDPE